MIRLEGVSRKWPEFAIKDVTLHVNEGEYVAIVGPTGAGKTLLLELLLGVHRPDRGRLFLRNQDVTDLPPEKRGIGMVYQDYLLFPHLSVADNLTFGLDYRHITQDERRSRVQEMGRLLGINHLLHRFPYTLSGGERQRVAIGRALINEPAMLLLDEPLSALDRHTSRRLRNELKALHRARNLTIIHVTHDLAEARQLADRVAVMHAGELNAYGKLEDLLRQPPTLFAADFLGAANVYEAACVQDQGGCSAVIGPIAASLPQAMEGTKYIMLLPDKLAILSGPATGKNQFTGEVTGLSNEAGHGTGFSESGRPARCAHCSSDTRGYSRGQDRAGKPSFG